jgi:hypothetical protein
MPSNKRSYAIIGLKGGGCHIPEKTVFKTKNQIGIEKILAAFKENIVKIDCIGFDAAYGKDSKFLDSFPECSEPIDASISDVSKCSLMRWSIELNFKENKISRRPKADSASISTCTGL